jgi:hypothetical protein
MGKPGGIHPALVPAIQNLEIFISLISIDEGAGSLFSFVTGITLHGNVLKKPFLFHTLHRRERRERRVFFGFRFRIKNKPGT